MAPTMVQAWWQNEATSELKTPYKKLHEALTTDLAGITDMAKARTVSRGPEGSAFYKQFKRLTGRKAIACTYVARSILLPSGRTVEASCVACMCFCKSEHQGMVWRLQLYLPGVRHRFRKSFGFCQPKPEAEVSFTFTFGHLKVEAE